jgi:hypothetical protein
MSANAKARSSTAEGGARAALSAALECLFEALATAPKAVRVQPFGLH